MPNLIEFFTHYLPSYLKRFNVFHMSSYFKCKLTYCSENSLTFPLKSLRIYQLSSHITGSTDVNCLTVLKMISKNRKLKSVATEGFYYSCCKAIRFTSHRISSSYKFLFISFRFSLSQIVRYFPPDFYKHLTTKVI